ncbi:hypothetical protein O1L60_37015 [Streptomyces diastatochromogenes]|nr:hypothetical protein [Streptomyces diastatochromogenes]
MVTQTPNWGSVDTLSGRNPTPMVALTVFVGESITETVPEPLLVTKTWSWTSTATPTGFAPTGMLATTLSCSFPGTFITASPS